MAAHFVESSDMGKLYLNYPMVEAFYHMSDIPDAAFLERIATLQELTAGTYKTRVNQENRNGDYTKFATTKEECSIVIAQNLQKAWGLVGTAPDMGAAVSECPDLCATLDAQLAMMEEHERLAVLCTCAFYIVEYNPGLLD